MFGSNPDGAPTTVTVGDITTHIRSDLIGSTSAVASHKNVDNKSNPFSLSSRGAASAEATSKQLNTINNADPEDLGDLLSSPIPGAALPGLTPEQLKSVKKNKSRAHSNMNVKRTFRPGDPRSPEMIMKKKAEEAEKLEQERLAAAKEKKRLGRSWGRERAKVEAIRKDIMNEEYAGNYDELVNSLNKFHTDNQIELANRQLKRDLGLKSRVKKKKIMTEEEKAQTAEMDKYLIFDADDDDERGDEKKNDSFDQNDALLGNSFDAEDGVNDGSYFHAGGGGFTEVDGVLIANTLIKAGDETDGRTLEGPPPTNLLCEECEKSIATLYSEVDSELLCQRCADLLYIPTSSGLPHVDVREGRVRKLRGNDTNRLHSAIVNNKTGAEIPEYEVDEDEMAQIRGYSLDKPSSIEAPEINLVNESAAKEINHTTGKFERGNVVFFSAEDLISEVERIKVGGHAAWRPKQLLGVVLAVPNVRHGAFGTAHRRISGNEIMYRVKVIRYVTAEYEKFPDSLELRGIGGGIPAGGGVKVIDSSVDNVDEDGAVKKATLTEEKQRAFKLDKQIELLEKEKKDAQKKFGEEGNSGDDDETNFAQWLKLLPKELERETIQDPQLRNSVVLLGERNLQFPSLGQKKLSSKRKSCLLTILKKSDRRMCNDDYKKIMIWWWHSVVKVGRAKDYNFTVKIQSQIRRWLVRFLLVEMTADRDDKLEWLKWWKIHRRFPYELDPEKQKKCYNVSGTSCFLPTLYMMNRWTRLWMFETNRMMTWMDRSIKLRYKKVFKKWTAEVNSFKTSEIARLKNLQKEEERLRQADLLEKENSEVTEGVDNWHPALGIVNMKGVLTPLPNMHCSYNTNGSLNVSDFPKYNSFQARQSGPTDTSAWLIPGQLLFGCYPEGKARLKGRQPAHGDVAARILMSNIGTFFNLMEEEEEDAFSIRKGDNLAKNGYELLRRRYGFLKSQLQSSVKKGQLAVQNANIEVSNVPRYPTNDTRYKDAMLKLHEAVAKQGLCIKNLEQAKADLNHFAKEFQYIRFPIPEGKSLEDDSTLLNLCTNIEERLRKGEKMYIFSRLGHGRVGLVGACLLGRIYGCKAEEALFRVQMYHDSKVSVKMSNRAFSCPQTVDQVAQVRRILSLGQGCYSKLVVKGNDAMVVYNVKRRVGVPKIGKGEIIEIDHDAMDLEAIGQEAELDEDEIQEAMTDNRHHCSATPGHGVAEIVPDPVYVSKNKVPLVLGPTIRSSRPHTLVEELREANEVSMELRQPLIQADGTIEKIDKAWIPPSKKKKKKEGEEEEQGRREKVALRQATG